MASENPSSESQKAGFLAYIESPEFRARYGPSPAERERRRLVQSLQEHRLLSALQSDQDPITLTAEDVGRRNIVALLEERLRTGRASSTAQTGGHPAFLRILPAALDAIAHQVARFASTSPSDPEKAWRFYVDLAITFLMAHPEAGRGTNFADPALADLRAQVVHGRLCQLLFFRRLPGEDTVVLVDLDELVYVPSEGSTPVSFRPLEPQT